MESRISAIVRESIGLAEIAPTIPHMAADLLSSRRVLGPISWRACPANTATSLQSYRLGLTPFALDIPTPIKQLGEEIQARQAHEALECRIEQQEPCALDGRASQNISGAHKAKNLRCLVEFTENIEIDRAHQIIFRAVRFMAR